MRSEHEHLPFLDEGGVSGELARSVDWARTPLGPPGAWPQSLKTVVGVILQSRHPMFLWWGPELIQFYNDAYLPSFGVGKHPAALGQRGRDCWPEIWSIIGPQIDDVMTRRRFELERGPVGAGVPQRKTPRTSTGPTATRPFSTTEVASAACWWSSPRRPPRWSSPGGLRTMRSLAERTGAHHRSGRDAGRRDRRVLQGARQDVPFALVYRYDGRSRALRLVRSAGLVDPATVDATVRGRMGPSPFGGREPRVELLPCDATCALPGGDWPEPAPALFVIPLAASGRERCSDVIVFGLSPRLPFDDGYRNHLTQIADHLGFAQAQINAFRIQAAADHERNNLLLQAPVGTALLSGREHVFRLANRLFCQMVRRDDLVGKPYREVFPRAEEGRLGGILDRVYETGEPFSTEEYRVPEDLQADGTRQDRYFRFNVQPLRDTEDRVYGMMAVATEISEQVRARQVLERSQEENQKLLQDLEAASRAKDEFLAMLGHELRNPLSPIVTSLQLMKLRGDNPNHPGAAGDRATGQLHLTQAGRRSPGRLQDHPREGGAAQGEGRDRRRHRQRRSEDGERSGSSNGTTIYSVDVAYVRLWVDGDPVRLAQVVANLLSYAARYTKPGGRDQCGERPEKKRSVTRRW